MDWTSKKDFRTIIGVDVLPNILVSKIWESNQIPILGNKRFKDGPKFPTRILNSLGKPKTILAEFSTQNFTLNDALGLDPLRLLMTPGMGEGTLDKLTECLQWCIIHLAEITNESAALDSSVDTDSAGNDNNPSITFTIECFLNSLEKRSQLVALHRLFSSEPMTLQAVAHDLDLTRERVRQIEQKIVNRLKNPKSTPEKQISHVIAEISDQVKIWATIESLIERIISCDDFAWWSTSSKNASSFEALTCCVQLLPVVYPKRFLIEESQIFQLDSDEEKIDVTEKIRKLSENGTILAEDLFLYTSELGIDKTTTNLLIRKMNLKPLGAFYILQSANVIDSIASALHIIGEPVRVDEILAVLELDNSIRSIGDRMASDERFVRVQKQLWALKEWPGYVEYSGIRSDIEKHIRSKGNSCEITELITDLQNRFNTNETSIRTYLTAPQYKIHEDIVYLIKPEQYPYFMGVPGDETLLHPTDRSIIGWIVKIDKDVMRGSGSVLRTKFAPLLGLQPGGKITYAGEFGDITLYWSSSLPQPSRSSIREIITNSKLEDFNEVFFVMDTTNKTFTVTQTKPF